MRHWQAWHHDLVAAPQPLLAAKAAWEKSGNLTNPVIEITRLFL
jgi:hypothetical protein